MGGGHPAGRAAAPLASRNDSQSSTRSHEASETEQGKTRILVVEDDFLIALQTEAALTDAGFEVIGSATTADEAIALARRSSPVWPSWIYAWKASGTASMRRASCLRNLASDASLRRRMTIPIPAD